jgi:hypothetical protein
VIGDARDSDGRMYSGGMLLLRPDGAGWSVLARRAEPNRDELAADPGHTVSTSRDELKNVELQYNRAFAGGELGIGLGFDHFGGLLHTSSNWRGFVQWRHRF